MAGDKGVEGSSEAESQPSGGSAAAISRTVFLSYASADAQVANQVCEALEAQGVPCWMAPRDVKPGAQYADAIVRAINDAKALVLVLSASAIGSSHVGREIERAASKHKQIIALRIDTAPLTPALEYFLSESQWIDVPALGMPAALNKLAEAVGQGSTTTSHGNSVSGGGGASGGSAVSRAVGTAIVAKRVVVAAVIVIVLGIASTLAIHFWPTKHPEAQAPAVAAISDKSIAVLPFADLSEKHDQGYFADGLSEELADVLSKIPDLRVIGHASSIQFKGKIQDLHGVGAQLGAAHVVEGSVRRSGDRVRVTAQLIHTSDGAREWSGTYDRSLDDLLKVQAEIAMSLGRALQLSVPDLRGMAVVPEAYDLYLRGLHSLDNYTRDGFEEANTFFQKAFEVDPHFVPAFQELAGTHLRQVLYAFVPADTGFAQVRDDATGLLKMDTRSSWGHAILCRYHVSYSWNWSEAGRECAAAFALAPHDWVVLFEAAELALVVGEYEKAARLFREVLSIDPLNADAQVEISAPLLRLGRLADAEAAVRRGLVITPTFAGAHSWLGVILMAESRFEDAKREFRLEGQGGDQSGLAMVYHALGRSVDSKAALDRSIPELADNSAFGIAEAYAYQDDADHAFEWLERAYRQKDAGLQYLKGDWCLRSLEHDPRYKAFLKKMNLPE